MSRRDTGLLRFRDGKCKGRSVVEFMRTCTDEQERVVGNYTTKGGQDCLFFVREGVDERVLSSVSSPPVATGGGSRPTRTRVPYPTLSCPGGHSLHTRLSPVAPGLLVPRRCLSPSVSFFCPGTDVVCGVRPRTRCLRSERYRGVGTGVWGGPWGWGGCVPRRRYLGSGVRG